MNVRVALIGAAVVAAAGASVAMAGGSPDADRHVKMVLPSAGGLRENSDVRVGGVSVGKVEELTLTPSDMVEIDLALKADDVALGRDASAAIAPVNLLGEKYVALEPGDPAAPMPPDGRIPAARVTPAVDLDQVLGVLDAETRTRLAILVNEAGIALAGRGADFNALLAKGPRALHKAQDLLSQVVSDNHTLGELIERSDRFVATARTREGDLGRMVEAASDAAATFSTRTRELQGTLERAPAALSTLRRFLTDLRTTARPLGPAARSISATAPALAGTLRQLPRFERTAEPVLREAVRTAPALTRLGEQATPVIRDSVPTLRALKRFSDSAAPATDALAAAIDDILATMEGWGRAISGRDGLGHVFHGRVILGAASMAAIIEKLTQPKQRGKRRRPSAGGRPVDRAVENLAPKPVKKPLEDATGLLDELTDDLPLPEAPKAPDVPSEPLLDFLLGP